MCICIVCVYVCIHVMRVVRLPHKLTYCFFPFSWGPNPFGGGGGHETGYRDHIYGLEIRDGGRPQWHGGLYYTIYFAILYVTNYKILYKRYYTMLDYTILYSTTGSGGVTTNPVPHRPIL